MNNVNFEVTNEEAQLILNTIGELPYKQSVKLIEKLLKQAQDQQSEANKAGETVPKPK